MMRLEKIIVRFCIKILDPTLWCNSLRTKQIFKSPHKPLHTFENDNLVCFRLNSWRKKMSYGHDTWGMPCFYTAVSIWTSLMHSSWYISFKKKLFREIYPSTSVKFMKLSPKCRSGCFQFSISCGAIGELGIVIHKNITTDAPIQIAANTRLNIFLTMFSGLNSWFSSRSCIVVLGDFPAYGLGYLSSFRELDALSRNHNHV